MKQMVDHSNQKSIVERAMEYLKDRTEAFDDCHPCMKVGLLNLRHVHKWLILFVLLYNSIVKSTAINFDDSRRWQRYSRLTGIQISDYCSNNGQDRCRRKE